MGCVKANQPLVRLEMYGSTQSALYIVKHDATVQFGGGVDALTGKTTWTGTLTPTQFANLQKLLENEPFYGSEELRGERFEVYIQRGDSYQQHTLPFTDATANELYYFLEESTLERIQVHLDSLPKPSMEVITERQMKGAKE